MGKIYEVVEECLARAGHLPAASLSDVFYADRRAREIAAELLGARQAPGCIS
jgi:1-deoxy-D-xylulose 5-phosphate reductoisomerase